VWAGVTGHQALTNAAIEWLTIVLPEAIARYRIEYGLSSLAAGADQLFVEALLRLGIPFEAVIPCAGYEEAFGDDPSRAGYGRLLSYAARVSQLDYAAPSEIAFFAAGMAIVERCELLVAVWNGRPARGLGGTADVVAYAVAKGKPIVQLNPLDYTIQSISPPTR
jgi:hypothetical protein